MKMVESRGSYKSTLARTCEFILITYREGGKKPHQITKLNDNIQFGNCIDVFISRDSVEWSCKSGYLQDLGISEPIVVHLEKVVKRMRQERPTLYVFSRVYFLRCEKFDYVEWKFSSMSLSRAGGVCMCNEILLYLLTLFYVGILRSGQSVWKIWRRLYVDSLYMYLQKMPARRLLIERTNKIWLESNARRLFLNALSIYTSEKNSCSRGWRRRKMKK